jgi:tetratricopeptide (TPR) repeat protein
MGDGRVPGYLGRVLDASGSPAGTCFQIAPGWLATAWHVLEVVEADDVGDVVSIDALTGGEQRDASVAAIDELADLALLKTDSPLRGSVAGLAATDWVELGTKVVVTGVSQVDDPSHTYKHLDAPGEWAGTATIDDQVPFGRLESKAIVPGMSGAPVRRQEDDVVVGVVSARYNSADGWLRDTVWVARSEQLGVLCNGRAAVTIEEPVFSGALDLVLSVDAQSVRLSGGSIDVSALHGGVALGLAGAIDDVRRARARLGAAREAREKSPIDEAGPGAGDLALARAGGMLAESFLQTPIADALADAIGRVGEHHQALRIGVACGDGLARLPWEALPSPAGGGPLALRPLVNVYRHAQSPSPQQIPGPLRILVAISSPLSGGGVVLDYERELRNVLAAVRAARQEAAHVRVVPFATTGAIRAALDAAPAHVLHLSGHAAPGRFVFEDDDGAARELDADHFLDEAIPPGRMPPVMALSACYTNVSAATGAPSFARRLLERGASVVIASETSVTDTYATRVFARLYGTMAGASVPDAVAAACDARRAVQAELSAATDERERHLAELGEWAVLSVLASKGSVPVFDPRVSEPPPPPPPRFTIGAVAARDVGDFVGRRAEQRRWPIELLAPNCSGLVLHGIGGVGKTTLAAELVGGVLERDPDRVVAVLSGELSIEGLIGTVVSAVRRHLAIHDRLAGPVARALAIAAQTDVTWADRIALLRENVFDGTSALIVIDNFEDNLDDSSANTKLRDPVLDELLADWIRDPAESRFLFTCRYPFQLAGTAARHLKFKPVGPLSAAETRKLVWSLPALDRLTDFQIEHAWRMVGGHPRALEYLDALLSKGTARYRDVRDRLSDAVERRLGSEAETFLTAERQLDDALAEVATLAADDVLLDELLAALEDTPGATELLIGASVYREPIDTNAVLFQVGKSDDSVATTPDRGAAREQIRAILAASGVPPDDEFDLEELPAEVQAQVKPHLNELARLPTPPRRTPSDLLSMVRTCVASSLLATEETQQGALFFVHRWTSSELERRWQAAERTIMITDVHRRAAAYWLWRVSVWPQDRRADVHDRLEARYHLLAAGRIDEATEVAGKACSQLHDWGAYDDEAKLIDDTLRYLTPASEQRAAWIHQLGILAEARGDLQQAETLYRQSLEISERLGSQAGMATSHHQLGKLAEGRGDMEQAETLYRQSLEINERLGNQAGAGTSYHQLGKLAEVRGDMEQAETLYRQSLEIDERLGNLAGVGASYGQLGRLAEVRGDMEQAETLCRQSLEISERLGNQADIATGYHQLGMLAEARGDLEQAETLCRQSLEISERLGNLAGMASSYHQLGSLAGDRGDLQQAETLYRQALEIYERLGSQGGMATGYHHLGIVAEARGDLQQAETLYRRSLELEERIGNRAGMASSYGQLGILAEARGDLQQAETLYRQSLEISERLGSQADMATAISQLAIVYAARGDVAGAIGLHGTALLIRARLGTPRISIDVRCLETHRAAIGEKPFMEALKEGIGPKEAANVGELLDEVANARDDS